jgi:hypothetical protein
MRTSAVLQREKFHEGALAERQDRKARRQAVVNAYDRSETLRIAKVRVERNITNAQFNARKTELTQACAQQCAPYLSAYHTQSRALEAESVATSDQINAAFAAALADATANYNQHKDEVYEDFRLYTEETLSRMGIERAAINGAYVIICKTDEEVAKVNRLRGFAFERYSSILASVADGYDAEIKTLHLKRDLLHACAAEYYNPLFEAIRAEYAPPVEAYEAELRLNLQWLETQREKVLAGLDDTFNKKGLAKVLASAGF